LKDGKAYLVAYSRQGDAEYHQAAEQHGVGFATAQGDGGDTGERRKV
jgi:hypothetical protein